MSSYLIFLFAALSDKGTREKGEYMGLTQEIPPLIWAVLLAGATFYLGLIWGSKHTYQAGQRDGYKRAMKKVERYGVDQ